MKRRDLRGDERLLGAGDPSRAARWLRAESPQRAESGSMDPQSAKLLEASRDLRSVRVPDEVKVDY